MKTTKIIIAFGLALGFPLTALAAAGLFRYDKPLSRDCTSLVNPATGQELDPSEWQKELPGDAYICDLSIPGTHESATGYNVEKPAMGKAQTMTLDDQLAQGIRAFDLRPVKNASKGWMCAHGSTTTNLTVAEALEKIGTFLEGHPSEFLIVMIWDEPQALLAKDFYTEFDGLLAASPLAERMADFRPDLKVSDLRGKVLMLSRIPLDKCEHYHGAIFDDKEWCDGKKWYDIKQSRMHDARDLAGTATKVLTQDIATLGTDDDLANKQDLTIQIMDFLGSHIAATPAQHVWAVSQLSAQLLQVAYAGGVYLDATNLALNGAKIARACNAWLCNYLVAPGDSWCGMTQDHQTPTGIVMMDWLAPTDMTDEDAIPGDSYNTALKSYAATLTKRVIENNFIALPLVNHAEVLPENFTDITTSLTNPYFMEPDAMGTAPAGWKDDSGFSGWVAGAIEQSNKTFDTYQEITELPAGEYMVACRGIYRQGTASLVDSDRHDSYDAHLDSSEDVSAFPHLYIGEPTDDDPALTCIYDSPLLGEKPNSPYHLADSVPTTLWQANVDLNGEKCYPVIFSRIYHHPGGSLRIGVKKTAEKANDFAALADFRLYRLDNTSGVNPAFSSEASAKRANVYNLNGQQLRHNAEISNLSDELPPDIYLVGNKKQIIR